MDKRLLIVVTLAVLAGALFFLKPWNSGGSSPVPSKTPAPDPNQHPNQNPNQQPHPSRVSKHLRVDAFEWRLEPSAERVKAGSRPVTLVNRGLQYHNLYFRRQGRKPKIFRVPATDAGRSHTRILKLTPGDYIIYCNVGGTVNGHRSLGMESRIEVVR